ncbi:winged helix-turn-helix domain-containing protein [Saccharibacillus kuerlensis]|uniref:winged helix-turn-helix domain-containing protein n=1 Tax=Saccharibacillus kuerlensis TaxID=459527 RepID=UPI000A06FA4A
MRLGRQSRRQYCRYDEGDSHYLRIYIGHLRKKLEEDPSQPRLIITEPGVGYRFLTQE